MRKYAQDTTVSVGKSRGEIDDLLRSWKCDGIQWTDNFSQGHVTLRFIWRRDGSAYMARFSIRMPDDKKLREMSRHGGKPYGHFLQVKYDRLKESIGRHEHRVLCLWIKAAFNAVDAGIVTAEEIFLPFLEGTDGRTVAEAALPRLPILLGSSAAKLLDAGQ